MIIKFSRNSSNPFHKFPLMRHSDSAQLGKVEAPPPADVITANTPKQSTILSEIKTSKAFCGLLAVSSREGSLYVCFKFCFSLRARSFWIEIMIKS